MATLEEVYADVLASDEEKKAFGAALRTPGGLDAFLAQRDCDATPEQVEAFLKETTAPGTEIDDAQLAAIAGGGLTEELSRALGMSLSRLIMSVAEVNLRTNEGYGGLTLEEWFMANKDTLLCVQLASVE